MSGILLIIAGLLEAFWAVGLKYTEGFTRPGPSILVGSAIAASMFLLGLAMRNLPVATAYAVWVGIGICGAAIGQHLFLDQSLRPAQVLFLILLMISVFGLKLTSSSR